MQYLKATINNGVNFYTHCLLIDKITNFEQITQTENIDKNKMDYKEDKNTQKTKVENPNS